MILVDGLKVVAMLRLVVLLDVPNSTSGVSLTSEEKDVLLVNRVLFNVSVEADSMVCFILLLRRNGELIECAANNRVCIRSVIKIIQP